MAQKNDMDYSNKPTKQPTEIPTYSPSKGIPTRKNGNVIMYYYVVIFYYIISTF